MSTANHAVPTASPIAAAEVTGLVMAGGRGSRMGGLDKGLQPWRGMPLALHALLRLQPQVGELMVNANRNLGAYEAFGAPVFTDAMPDHPGPLAGFLAGLTHAATPWLMVVPCDAPHFPQDLVARLAQAIAAEGAELAMPAYDDAGERHVQPVFCLMSTALLPSLQQALAEGERKIMRWARSRHLATVVFDSPAAFANLNTLPELQGAAAPGAD